MKHTVLSIGLFVALGAASTAFAQVQRGADLDSPVLAPSRYGTSVCMPDDHTLAAAGPWLGEHGGVAVNVWNGAEWVLKGDVILAPAEWAGASNWGEVVSMPDAQTVAASSQVFFMDGSNPRTAVVEWNGESWAQKGSVLAVLSVHMADAAHLALFAEDAEGEVRPVTLEWNGTDWVPYGAFPSDVLLDWGERGQVFMADAQTVAVGMAQTGSNAGSVTVFELIGNAWVPKGQPLEAEDNQDYFGWSLSMPDANTLAVGARGAGSVYVFTFADGDWNQKGNTLTGFFLHEFGYSVSMPDPDHIAVGLPESEGDNGLWSSCGAVRVYQFNYEPGWSYATWVTQNHPAIHGEGPENLWGRSVSMPSPQTVAAGAPENYGPDGAFVEACGHARVYDLNFPPIATTGVVAAARPDRHRVQPNPSTGRVCLTGDLDARARWVAANGATVLEGPAERCYDLERFGPGMYFLYLEGPVGREVHRVLVVGGGK